MNDIAEQFAPNSSVKRVSFSQRLKAHLELIDPVTWISAATMVFCGAITSGRVEPGFQIIDGHDLLLVGLAILMCGPLGTGFSQSINDYFDRDLDAINDPGRPIPSGRLTLLEARLNWILLGLATLGVSFILARYNAWIPLLGALSLILAAAYSIPPIKLKQNFWLGPPAVAFGYVSMSWISGQLIFAALTLPSLILALINSSLATGLLYLNDIKSVEGDRALGLQSMTVVLGVKRTLTVAFLVIGCSEIMLLILALLLGHMWAALIVLLALLVPIYSQVRLYREPSHKNFKRYIVASNPFIVLTQLTSGFIVGGYFG